MSRIIRFLARERRKIRRRVNLLDVGVPAGLTEDDASSSVSPHASSAASEGSIANVPAEEDSGIESQLSVELTDEMMVIRLEAVDEDNYGPIISALKERGKRWELTNEDGERILKILP